MDKHPDNLQAALEARAMGYTPVAILPGQKVPAEPWGRWFDETPTVESIHERWAGTRNGLALLCKDLLVFDVDDENKLDFVLDACGVKDAPICRTPGGGYHVHARPRKGVDVDRKMQVKGEPVDLLTKRSLSIVPFSTNAAGVPYAWLTALKPYDELPIARIGWTRERVRRVTSPIIAADTPDAQRLLYRGRKYVDTFERSVSGSHGHTTTFLSARKIVRFVRSLGGDEAAMWALLTYYNATKCDPPWRESPELTHKLKEALKKADG